MTQLPLIDNFKKILTALMLGMLINGTGYCYEKTGQHIDWEQLNLSSQQRQELRKIDHEWLQTKNSLAPKLETNETMFYKMSSQNNPNEKNIMKLRQQINQDKAKLDMEATRCFLMKKKVLTPQQQQQLMQMLNQH